MRKILRVLALNNLDSVAQNISENMFKLLISWKITSGVVGGYLPFFGEISLDPLWKRLLISGFSLSLPIVREPAHPLVFAKWAPGDLLREGALGTKIPGQTHLVSPSVLLVPLLSFDEKGYRLGRGGGFYDATIQMLRPTGVQIIGVGFDVQKEQSLPREPHDQPLDAVVTEKQVYVFEPRDER